jgi:transcription elongation GreA/GreB family factor
MRESMTKENVQCVADAQEAVDAAEQALLKARKELANAQSALWSPAEGSR